MVEEGASLVVDNSDLIGCGIPPNETWKGIKVVESPIGLDDDALTKITIRNFSNINNADIGIKVTGPFK